MTNNTKLIEGKDFEIIQGLPDCLIGDLIKNSLCLSDTDLQTTSDRKRFNSVESINEWKKKGRTIYTLKDLKTNELLGIFWFGKKEIELKEPEANLNIDYKNYSHTFAMRLYGRLRGVGMFKELTVKILDKYINSGNYDNTGFWGESHHGGMVKVCESIGMKQVSAKKIDTSKITSNLDNPEVVFIIDDKTIKANIKEFKDLANY